MRVGRLIGAATAMAAASMAPYASAQDGGQATASLQDADGNAVGTVTLQETPNGVLVQAEFQDLPPGTHAVHIHEVGTCEPPSFESAGDHFNPAGNSHGFRSPDGPHAGDMPNIHVPSSGALDVDMVTEQIALGDALFDDDGSAFLVHASRDDYETDPSGDAGERLACGVIER